MSKAMATNFVSGPYRAVIDGAEAALAGCDQSQCDRRAYCLRADKQLMSRTTVKPGKDSCVLFIPVRRVDV